MKYLSMIAVYLLLFISVNAQTYYDGNYTGEEKDAAVLKARDSMVTKSHRDTITLAPIDVSNDAGNFYLINLGDPTDLVGANVPAQLIKLAYATQLSANLYLKANNTWAPFDSTMHTGVVEVGQNGITLHSVDNDNYAAWSGSQELHETFAVRPQTPAGADIIVKGRWLGYWKDNTTSSSFVIYDVADADTNISFGLLYDASGNCYLKMQNPNRSDSDMVVINTNGDSYLMGGQVGINRIPTVTKFEVEADYITDGIRLYNQDGDPIGLFIENINEGGALTLYDSNTVATVKLGAQTSNKNYLAYITGIGTTAPDAILDVGADYLNDDTTIGIFYLRDKEDSIKANFIFDADGDLYFQMRDKNHVSKIYLNTDDGSISSALYNFASDTSTAAQPDIYDLVNSTIGNYGTYIKAGTTINWIAATANTGACNILVNAFAEKDLFKLHDQELASGDIEVGQACQAMYDGTQWQLISQLAQ